MDLKKLLKPKKKEKDPQMLTLLIYIFMFLTAVISLVSRVYDRKNIIQQIEKDKELMDFIETKKKTSEI